MRWSNFTEASDELKKVYESSLKAGMSDDMALAKAAAMLATHRNDIANIDVSFGIMRSILIALDVVDASKKKNHTN